ncbi:H-2 class II histocompatibility antigen, I-E beta chain-like isoform X3 [Hemicordylus capensis]|uniref:H-2 class II histocompatibility antigen, I-E beta chain-like isoform X3 n=1 Tax=Hemicordylus capensis TaxID=884348 RepID=UPI002303AE6B|nr:H-2 class II histocompatibility antigen, I-E beta chain-like isoform X3 [Hemicordylus capensis]
MRSALDFGVLLVTMAGLGGFPPQVQSAGPREHFVYQMRPVCFFTPLNGTQLEIHFLLTYTWGRQDYVRFDSRVGEYRAIMPLGEPDARYWNSQKATLESERHNVDRFCRHNYEVDGSFARTRSEIEIKWLRNGKEEGESKVATTDLMRNGDWTYQIHVMLETHLECGDLYACQVEHSSLNGTVITVQWDPQSDSARNKMWTGVMGVMLGLVFFLPGLVLFLKNKKGRGIPQPAGLIS